MRRAWEKLGLEAVLTLEDKPTVYFKHVTKKNPTEEAELHRLLWNQGTATLLVVRDPAEVRVYSALAAPDKKPVTEKDDARLVETLQHVRSALELIDFVRRVETGRIYYDHRQSESFKAERGVGRRVLVEHIPASVCEHRGEATFARETTEHIRRLAHGAGHPVKTVPLDVFALA
jgi:hypothetical protein